MQSISLVSVDDEQDCEPYTIPSTAKPLVTGDTNHCGSPNPTAMHLHDIRRRAAGHLVVGNLSGDHHMSGQSACILQEEIISLQNKKAIRLVPQNKGRDNF
ncbi:hypothetical protein GOODEAATRI_029388 [Goodea atripinnis]|uniref:Uncharacterized protein n=1 Tax=Goodea atripinnis TaxID=208336 RepID=A0ABV0P1I3_9TELE